LVQLLDKLQFLPRHRERSAQPLRWWRSVATASLFGSWSQSSYCLPMSCIWIPKLQMCNSELRISL